MRRGLKKPVLDMAPGDLLRAGWFSAGSLGERVDVGSRAGDGGDRRLVGRSLMTVMGSCGDGGLDGCLGAATVA